MLTEKDYCDYDTCVALKELGYKEPSNWWYSSYKDENDKKHIHLIKDHPQSLTYESWHICPKDFIICPSLYEAQEWLRTKKKLHITVDLSNSDYFWKICKVGEYEIYFDGTEHSDHDKYESCLADGIKEAIKLLKEESNGN